MRCNRQQLAISSQVLLGAVVKLALNAAPLPGEGVEEDVAGADQGGRPLIGRIISSVLQQLIQIALDNNRDLRLAALNVERTQALYRIQRADRLPSVNGSFGLQRQPSVLTGEQTSKLQHRSGHHGLRAGLLRTGEGSD